MLLASGLLIGCSEDPIDPSEPLTARVDFSTGLHGWTAGFSDYPPADEEIYHLRSDYRTLPTPLDTSQQALFISGVNRSDDLFMYWKGQIVGLSPGTRYRASFEVEFATSAPSGCAGVGGAPGENVYIKAGATDIEPESVLDGSYLIMNIDKGNQSTSGDNAVVLGDIASSQPCAPGEEQWELKQLVGTATVDVTADREGRVWLLVGSDSGFESISSLYYTRVLATFEPI
jgi:hypothetical protein